MKVVRLKCPVCGREFEAKFSGPHDLPPGFPFCSPRCKLIDLGRWLSEEYKISVPLPGAESLSEGEKRLLVKAFSAEDDPDGFLEGEDHREAEGDA